MSLHRAQHPQTWLLKTVNRTLPCHGRVHVKRTAPYIVQRSTSKKMVTDSSKDSSEGKKKEKRFLHERHELQNYIPTDSFYVCFRRINLSLLVTSRPSHRSASRQTWRKYMFNVFENECTAPPKRCMQVPYLWSLYPEKTENGCILFARTQMYAIILTERCISWNFIRQYKSILYTTGQSASHATKKGRCCD